ncbi:MAG: hypothetical protein ACT4TC_26270 [Myxococcaceae bacterium]
MTQAEIAAVRKISRRTVVRELEYVRIEALNLAARPDEAGHG